MRRFYGKSRDSYMAEMRSLLRYSKNYVDEPSMFRGPSGSGGGHETIGGNISDETRQELIDALDEAGASEPGFGAGDLPEDEDDLVIFEDEEPAIEVGEGPLPDAPPTEEN